jgi:hypothetical protein
LRALWGIQAGGGFNLKKQNAADGSQDIPAARSKMERKRKVSVVQNRDAWWSSNLLLGPCESPATADFFQHLCSLGDESPEPCPSANPSIFPAWKMIGVVSKASFQPQILLAAPSRPPKRGASPFFRQSAVIRLLREKNHFSEQQSNHGFFSLLLISFTIKKSLTARKSKNNVNNKALFLFSKWPR